jgi:nucleoside-diphosphate-sugar epimerase
LFSFHHFELDFQIYGDGTQTRSFQYVSDLVDGLIALMNSNYTQPVNLGNPIESTIKGKGDLIGLYKTFYCHNKFCIEISL